MKQHTTQLNLAQLIAITICSAILLSEPKFATVVAIFVGFTMAFSMGSAMAMGHYYSSRGIEKISDNHASLLGTHFGGMFCYLIMICKAFEYIR